MLPFRLLGLLDSRTSLAHIAQEARVHHRSPSRLVAVLVLALASPAVRVEAQSAGGSASPPLVPIPYRTYIAVDPLGIPLDIGSIEVESAIANGVTGGGSASYTDLDHKRYTSFDAKVRYYPGEVVLRGFSIGGTVGVTKFASDTANAAGVKESFSAPTVGVALDYNFMLGERGRFVVGTGISGKRVLASAAKRDLVGIDRSYPSARFVVGLAF